MRWLGVIVLPLVVVLSLLVMLGGASDHPLAGQASPSVCGALRSGPSGGVPVQTTTPSSPLGEYLGEVAVCDIVARAGLVSIAVRSRQSLIERGGEPDSAAWLAARIDALRGEGLSPEAAVGPWREAWRYQPPGDPRRFLVAEDNGIVIEAATRADAEMLLDSARRASEALRAALP